MTIYDDNRTLGWHFHVPADAPPADLVREAIMQASVLRDLVAEQVGGPLASRTVVLVDVLQTLRERMGMPESFGFDG